MSSRFARACLATAAGATLTCLAAVPAAALTAPHRPGTGDPPSAPPLFTNANCTLTGPAAAGGTPTDNCGRAGYLAGSRTFRYAKALITVPDHTGSVLTDPQIYVALDDSLGAASYTFVQAGVSPCLLPGATTGARRLSAPADGGGDAITPACPAGDTSGWVAYVRAERNGTTLVSELDTLSASMAGDRVLASLYQEPSGQVVDASLRLPDGTLRTYSVSIPGATFRWAQAQADWTIDHANGTATAPVFAPAAPIRDTAFGQGAFTTSSGQRGTFSGPWSLSAVEATTNGTAARPVVARPSRLWNDGAGSGPGDAFGVWRLLDPLIPAT